jgi:hypothetical protein
MLKDYYFGGIEARRVVWHIGRDIVLDPMQDGEPLLWNPKGYCEIDGVSVGVKRVFSFASQK